MVIAREREEKGKEEEKGNRNEEKRKYFLSVCLDIGREREMERKYLYLVDKERGNGKKSVYFFTYMPS